MKHLSDVNLFLQKYRLQKSIPPLKKAFFTPVAKSLQLPQILYAHIVYITQPTMDMVECTHNWISTLESLGIPYWELATDTHIPRQTWECVASWNQGRWIWCWSYWHCKESSGSPSSFQGSPFIKKDSNISCMRTRGQTSLSMTILALVIASVIRVLVHIHTQMHVQYCNNYIVICTCV